MAKSSTAFGVVLILSGAIISLTVVGAIIGIPMIIFGILTFFGIFAASGASKAAGATANGASKAVGATSKAASSGSARMETRRHDAGHDGIGQVLFQHQEKEQIRAHSHLYYRISVDRTSLFTCKYNVNDGGPINVFLTNPEQYERYSERLDYQVLTGGAQNNTWGGQIQIEVQAGDYVLVFDNMGPNIDTGEPVELKIEYQASLIP